MIALAGQIQFEWPRELESELAAVVDDEPVADAARGSGRDAVAALALEVADRDSAASRASSGPSVAAPSQ